MLVRDVAGDRLDQILDRHQPVDPAIFIDHQRKMHPLQPHLRQQVQHRHLRRHHQRLAHDRLQRERLRPADIGEHVLDVDHADHIVQLLPVHRQAGVSVVADQFDRLCQRHIRPHRHDIRARHHHVVGRCFPQPQHIGDQQPLMPVQFRGLTRRLLRVRRLLHQLRDGVAQGMLRLLAPKQIAQPPQQGAPVRAHARFHGLGTPIRCRMRDSAISIRRASPG
ncbi:hypothetical protein GALL_491480 [mine drainage metagenome]|uniref:Uncharacterized protein n=1 Tax=mine drainage metagenome TaxID=410659 RepID=A0A1J5PVD1_9ZZZZ